MSKAEREAQIYSRLDGTTRPLETYSVVELRGITLFYKMNIGNLGNKRKSDLIKAISANVKYKAKIRRVEQRKIASETLEERREKKKKQVIEAREQREMEQLQAQQTIGDAILEKGVRTSNTGTDWYAEELRFELNESNARIDAEDIIMGDFLFFGYDARFPEKYEYYDRRPLAFMLKVVDDNKILGYNIHYLNPGYRGGISESMLNKTAIDVRSLPEKGLHSYIIGNMNNIYRIPRNVGEYRDIAKLITEDFVDENGGKYDINAVWDSVN